MFAYKPSIAEQWIFEKYQANGITNHDDLNIDLIADIWSIDIIYSNIPRSFAHWDNTISQIYLPRQCSMIDQRSSFFHELSHVLMHAGNQRKMPKLLRALQESQAEQFTLYASMPYPMIRPYLKDHTPTEIAEEFKISTDLVLRRIEQIRNRMIANNELLWNTNVRQYSDPPKPKWSEETIKVMRQLNRILLNKQHFRHYGA